MDYSPPDSFIHGILPYPGDLPDPGIELGSPALQVDYLPSGRKRNSCSRIEHLPYPKKEDEFLIFPLGVFQRHPTRIQTIRSRQEAFILLAMLKSVPSEFAPPFSRETI